jgi:hypothetical protein
MTDIDWARIARELQAPFPETEIKTKPGRGGKPLSYVDRSLVAERLDAVVGPENWHFDWLPMVSDAEQIRVVKGTLTIYGISKSDVGDSADGDEPNKSAVSDAFKRVAALWGVARYLARKSAPAPAPGRPQEPRPREQPQEPRNGRQATPNTPPPARAASPPAGGASESREPLPTGVVINPGLVLAGRAYREAANQAGFETREAQDKFAREQYPGRGLSTLTADEWHALELQCRAMYSDVPAPEEAPIF